MAIREARPDDAPAVAALSGQLGYPVEPSVMQRRLEAIAGRAGQAVFVADAARLVVGWIDVSVVHHVQAEPRAEIGGLVVDADWRGSRVGARLVARAEAWAREQGLRTILVRSQAAREAAHRFYLREGYDRTKTSAVFTKTLGAAQPPATTA